MPDKDPNSIPDVGKPLPPSLGEARNWANSNLRQSARAQIDRWELYQLLADYDERWHRWGIVEVAVRNPQVAEYCQHWEERTKKAETALTLIKKLLVPSGDYAICRKDGTPMGLSDQMVVVDVFEKADEVIP